MSGTTKFLIGTIGEMADGATQVHKGTKMVRDVGRCIYCGRHGEGVRLTKEHIIPHSLGAGAYLKNASCDDCAAITKGIEQHVARSIFGHHRIHKGVQTRHPEQRPSQLPARVLVRGIEHRHDIAIKDHPYFLAMPVWDQPGLLRGRSPSVEFDGLAAHLFYHIPPNIRDSLNLSDGEMAEIRPDSKVDANRFGRAIAKIAYCNAIATLGLDGIGQSDLPAVILGTNPNVSFFVGSVLQNPPPPNRNGPDHRIDIGLSDFVLDPRTGLYRRFLVSNVRLFARDGTQDNGMPLYTVIVGSPT